MAIRLTRSTKNFIWRSTDLLNYNAAYTVMMWFRRVGNVGTNQWMDIFDFSNTGGDTDCLQLKESGGNYLLNIYTNGPAISNNDGSNIAIDTWYHLCFVRTDSSHCLAYINGNLDITSTAADQSTRNALDHMYIGTWQNSDDYADARFFAVKIWTAALTLAEILQEMNSIRPSRTANLYSFLPTFPGNGERYLDYSGAGRDWTETLSPTDEDPPSISWGSPVLYASAVSSVLISGTVCWGHVTGVTEDNVRTFAGNWTGTGTINSSGDSEYVSLQSGQYMESEVVNTGSHNIQLLQNNYVAGDNVTLKYRHGATEADCLAASYSTYSTPFSSLGYVQVRIESTL